MRDVGRQPDSFVSFSWPFSMILASYNVLISREKYKTKMAVSRPISLVCRIHLIWKAPGYEEDKAQDLF